MPTVMTNNPFDHVESPLPRVVNGAFNRVPVFSTMGRGPRGVKGEAGVIEYADPIEHDTSRTYKSGVLVLAQDGTTYLSKKYVPIGVSLSDSEYWQILASPNAQVERYRQDVAALGDRVNDIDADINDQPGGLKSKVASIEEGIASMDGDIDTIQDDIIDIRGGIDAVDERVNAVDENLGLRMDEIQYLSGSNILYSGNWRSPITPSVILDASDLDALPRFAGATNNMTFQGCYFYNNFYYVAYYTRNPRGWTHLRKYNSNLEYTGDEYIFRLNDSEGDPIQIHCNSINLNPNRVGTTLLVSGNTDTGNGIMLYEFDPDDLNRGPVSEVRFMAAGGFCISADGQYAMACMSVSDSYLVYRRTGDAYVVQGVTPSATKMFPGRQQIVQYKDGYCRLCSRSSNMKNGEYDVLDTTGVNTIEFFTKTGQHKFSIAFPNIGIEFEGITPIVNSAVAPVEDLPSYTRFLLTTVRGHVLLLDCQRILEYISQNVEFSKIESTNNELMPSWWRPSDDNNDDIVHLTSSGNVPEGNDSGNGLDFMVRAYLPSMWRMCLSGLLTGFIGGPGQAVNVAVDTDTTQATISGFVVNGDITAFVKLGYKAIGDLPGVMRLSSIAAKNIETGYVLSHNFSVSMYDNNTQYATELAEFMAEFKTNNSDKLPISASGTANGFWGAGIVPTSVRTDLVGAVTGITDYRHGSVIKGLVDAI